MTTEEMIEYDMIVTIGIATSNELNLARAIMSGTWKDVFNTVVYIRTGYRNLQDYIEAEDVEDVR